MKWETIKKDIILQLDGLGIVFYSEGAVKNIPAGMNFLTEAFWKPERVEEHNKKGMSSDLLSISRKINPRQKTEFT